MTEPFPAVGIRNLIHGIHEALLFDVLHGIYPEPALILSGHYVEQRNHNKAAGLNLLCPVNNQDIAVKNPHVHIAGTFNLHENGGRRMLDENVI